MNYLNLLDLVVLLGRHDALLVGPLLPCTHTNRLDGGLDLLPGSQKKNHRVVFEARGMGWQRGCAILCSPLLLGNTLHCRLHPSSVLVIHTSHRIFQFSYPPAQTNVLLRQRGKLPLKGRKNWAKVGCCCRCA